MADLFISYSRKDKEFVRALHTALTAQGHSAWVDWEDIPLTADWLKEIYEAIEAADTFVFVISPDSVAKQNEFSATNSFDFPLLSDPDGAVATQFGVRRRFGPLLTKRQTFVIDTDRTVLEVIKSEVRMSVHADKALEALRAR